MATYFKDKQIIDFACYGNSAYNTMWGNVDEREVVSGFSDPIISIDLHDQIAKIISTYNSKTLSTNPGSTTEHAGFYKIQIPDIDGYSLCVSFDVQYGGKTGSTISNPAIGYMDLKFSVGISTSDIDYDTFAEKYNSSSATNFYTIPTSDLALSTLRFRRVTYPGYGTGARIDTQRDLDYYGMKIVPLSIYLLRATNTANYVWPYTKYNYKYFFFATGGIVNSKAMKCLVGSLGDTALYLSTSQNDAKSDTANYYFPATAENFVKNYGTYPLSTANEISGQTMTGWKGYDLLLDTAAVNSGSVLGEYLYSNTSDYQKESITPSDFGNESTQINYGSAPENVPSSLQPTHETPAYSYNGIYTTLVPTDVQFGNIIGFLQNNIDYTDTDIFNNVINVLTDTWGSAMDYINDVHFMPFSISSSNKVRMVINKWHTPIVSNLADDTLFRACYDSDYAGEGLVIPKLYIPAKTGSYLDYEPYTSIMIYLPFVGYHNLQPSDVVGKYLVVDYTIDIVTGDFVVYLRVDETKDTDEGRYISEFSGNMAMHVPLTGKDYTAALSRFTGAIAHGAELQTTAGNTLEKYGGGYSKTTGDSGTTISSGDYTKISTTSTLPRLDPASAAQIGVGIGELATGGMKADVERGGSLSGSVSMLTERRPYIIMNSPVMFNPKNKIDIVGNPVYFKGKLSKSVGVTKVMDGHLENMSCLEEECEQIMNILRGGIII